MNSTSQELAEALESELESEANRGIRVDFSKLTLSRILAAILASALLVLFVIWAIAVTVDNARQVQVSTLGYEVISPDQTQVKFAVKQPAIITDEAVCQVTALDQSFAVVGYKEIVLSEGIKAGEPITVNLNTTGEAVSGLVDACRLK
ncbi:MAG: hypothetical protein RL174_182 [Actinomycetota bacterium]|jgi:hypothetical protein